MSGLAAPVVYQWVNGKLTGDATLMALGSPPLSTGQRVWPDHAHQGAVAPYLIHSMLSGTPLKTVGNTTVWTEMVWLVRGVDHATTVARLVPILNRARTVLDGAKGSVSGGDAPGTVFFSMAEDEVRYEEDLGGGTWAQHLGLRFRILGRAS